jgi:hypothetical protein
MFRINMPHPLIPFDKLLSEAWLASKAHWRSTLKWTVTIAVLSSAVGLLQNTMSALGGTSVAIAAMSILLSLLLVVALTVLSYGLLRVLVGAELKPKHLPEFWTGFLRIAIAGFVQFLGMAAVVLVGVTIGGGALYLSRDSGRVIAGIFVFIESVAMFAAFIWASVKLSFTGTAILAQNLGAIEAIKDSWNLTNGRWWAIFGRNIILALVLAACSLAVGLGTFIVIGIIVAIGALILNGADMPSIGAIVQMGPSGLWTSTGLFLMAGAAIVVLLLLAIRIPFTIFQLLYGMSAHLSLYRSLEATKGSHPAIEAK